MDRLEGFAVPLSPGVFAVHEGEQFVILQEGQAAGDQGLEQLAEDGVATALGTSLASSVTNGDLTASGVFDTSVDGAEGPIGPGGSYQFTIPADAVGPDAYLSLVTMMVQSNDIVYSTPDEGIPLFDANGNPLTGDISTQMVAYDAGTEVDEFPGAGLNQPIRQAAPDTGTDEGGVVTVVAADDRTPSEEGFIYRPVEQRIRVTITPN